jgi:hypothetical protein
MKRRELRATSAEIAISLLMFTGQIEGMALHYDTPIPPPKGPQRTLILHNRGVEQLHTAKTLFSKAYDQLGCPRHHRLDSPHAPWWVYKPTRPGRTLVALMGGDGTGRLKPWHGRHLIVRCALSTCWKIYRNPTMLIG